MDWACQAVAAILGLGEFAFLDDPDAQILAAGALESFGPAAVDALPKLRAMAQTIGDAEYSPAEVARRAIERIEGSTPEAPPAP